MIIMAMLFVKGKMYPKQFTVYTKNIGTCTLMYSVIIQNVCSMQACMGGGLSIHIFVRVFFYMDYDGVTKEG